MDLKIKLFFDESENGEILDKAEVLSKRYL